MNDNRSICGAIGEQLARDYLCEPFADGVLVVTPYAYPDGQPVQLFALQTPESMKLSDMRGAYLHLTARGWNPRRGGTIIRNISRISREYGLIVTNDEVSLVVPSFEDLGKCAHRTALASKEIGDLSHLLNAQKAGDLSGRVETFLEDHNFRHYRTKEKIVGRMGVSHTVDFFFSDTKTPEQVSAKPEMAFVETLPSAKNFQTKRAVIFAAFSDFTMGQKIVVAENALSDADQKYLARVADDLVIWNREDHRGRLMSDLSRFRVTSAA